MVLTFPVLPVPVVPVRLLEGSLLGGGPAVKEPKFSYQNPETTYS